ESQVAESECAGVVSMEHPGRLSDGPDLAVLLPQPDKNPSFAPRLAASFWGRTGATAGFLCPNPNGGRTMNPDPFVADPEWHWWIILYFYLGGIAAGAYFTATLIDLWATKENRELARLGYWVTFPLVMLCTLCLVVDLNQPHRFWHMLFKSEMVEQALDEGWPWTGSSWSLMARAPLLKYWSP